MTMARLLTLAGLLLSVPMMAAAGAAKAQHETAPAAHEPGPQMHKPSPGAEGMPGAKGTFDFKPEDWKSGVTSWWKDTDGIAPQTPGCHVGTDSKGAPNGRMFGEACLANGLLVESNPGAFALHSHADDVGHPDTFDCNEWCIGTGASEGVCAMVYYADAPAPCKQSARCQCQ
jgi:hypothetical protein